MLKSVLITGILFILIISGPLLVGRSETGISLHPEAPVRLFTSIISGFADGSTFEYTAKRTDYNMADTLPACFMLSSSFIFPAALISLFLGIALGITLAFRNGPVIESVLSFFHVIPDFLLAIFLQLFSITMYQTFGFRIARIAYQHAGKPAYLLPILTMVISATVFVTRLVEGYARRVREQEYMLYAESRGLPRRSLIGTHLLVPVLHYLKNDFGRLLALLMGSLFIIERLFSIPGVTTFLFAYAFDSVHNPVMNQFNVAFWGFFSLMVMYWLIHGLLVLVMNTLILWRQR